MYKVNNNAQKEHDRKKHKPLTCGLSSMDFSGLQSEETHIGFCPNLMDKYHPHSLAVTWENPGRLIVRD